MLLLGPTDSHIIIHDRENQSKERQLASRQGIWQGSWEDSLGGAEKDCKVVESTMAVGNGFLQVYPCFSLAEKTGFD